MKGRTYHLSRLTHYTVSSWTPLGHAVWMHHTKQCGQHVLISVGTLHSLEGFLHMFSLSKWPQKRWTPVPTPSWSFSMKNIVPFVQTTKNYSSRGQPGQENPRSYHKPLQAVFGGLGAWPKNYIFGWLGGILCWPNMPDLCLGQHLTLVGWE